MKKLTRWLHKKFLNSVGKKYAIGYVVVGIVALVVVAITSYSSMYINRVYQNRNLEMRAINDLEQSIQQLNRDIYETYVSMNQDGIDRYRELRADTQKQLDMLVKLSQKQYVREIVDLTNTIEAYLESSDLTMGRIESYVLNKQTTNLSQIQSGYGEQQDLYTYVVTRFQDAYSVKLLSLSKVQEQLDTTLKRGMIVIAILVTLGMIFVIAYGYRIILAISHAVSTLENGVIRFQNNIATAEQIELYTGDEFEHLAKAYNEMQGIICDQMHKIEENAQAKERLNLMEKENISIYAKLQKNHLDFLQSRINPHFMFNTLNLITAQARLENADATAELLTLTASFLRYNLDNITKTVTLREELSNLQDYISIQKCRFANRFAFCIDADPSTYGQLMPCMILQPMVENAIAHGVGSKLSGGFVEVHVYQIEDRVLIEVEDNGEGMSEEEIARLYERISSQTDESNHIGIRNIYRRLQLFYKNDVKLCVENRRPGLRFQISIPQMETQENS